MLLCCDCASLVDLVLEGVSLHNLGIFKLHKVLEVKLDSRKGVFFVGRVVDDSLKVVLFIISGEKVSKNQNNKMVEF